MKKGLIKFLLSSLIVLILVIFIDFTIGITIKSMLPNISNKEDIGKTYFSLNDVNTPIVVVGSSRASHHYVTSVIENEYNKETYNVARDGCFFSYNCCVMNSILDRYNPEIIIWENDINSLYENVNDPLESLYPYYKQNSYITSILKEQQVSDIIKLNFNLYRYNSIIHKIVVINFAKNKYKDKTIKGYLPLTPKENLSRKALEASTSRNNYDLSQNKITLFKNTLDRAKKQGVKIIVVDSPKYMLLNTNSISADTMERICNEYDATFINNTQLPLFLEHPEYFNDMTHLNNIGANIYTNIFLSQIKDRINK